MPTEKKEQRKKEQIMVLTLDDIYELSVDVDMSELAQRVSLLTVEDGFETATAVVKQVKKKPTSKSAALSAFARSLDDLVRKRDEEDRKSVKEYLIAISSGLDPDELPMNRYVPIRIYLKDGSNKEDVLKAVEEFSSAVGFTINDAYEPKIGSWLQKLIGKSKDAITHEEVVERLKKLSVL